MYEYIFEGKFRGKLEYINIEYSSTNTMQSNRTHGILISYLGICCHANLVFWRQIIKDTAA